MSPFWVHRESGDIPIFRQISGAIVLREWKIGMSPHAPGCARRERGTAPSPGHNRLRSQKQAASGTCSRHSSKRCRKSSPKTVTGCCHRRHETGHKSWRTSFPLRWTRKQGRRSCLLPWSREPASQTRGRISYTEIQIWALPPREYHQVVRCYRNQPVISR
jgi:hypothetical protein